MQQTILFKVEHILNGQQITDEIVEIGPKTLALDSIRS